MWIGAAREKRWFILRNWGNSGRLQPDCEEANRQFSRHRLTRRGQGESEKPSSGYDMDSLVEDIRAFLDVLKIKLVVFVGYSVAGNEET